MTALAQTQTPLLPQKAPATAPADPTAPASPAGEATPPAKTVELPEFDPAQILTDLSETTIDYLTPMVTPWAFLQLLVIVFCYGVSQLLASLVKGSGNILEAQPEQGH